jgi:hypothetical protein
MGLGLPCIASVVKQCGLQMVLEGLFQLYRRLTVQRLGRN